MLVTGVALSAVSAALTVSGSDSDLAWLEALARASMVGVPIAVGVYAWRRPPFDRFGRLLTAAGGGWFVTTLAESGEPLPHSVGRVAGWLVEVMLLYLVLAFPTGRLATRSDRALVGALGVVVAALYLPSALLVAQYPVPSPWASCTSACPDNAFQLVEPEPAFVADALRPVRDLLTAAIFVAAAARLGQRMQGDTRLTRRTLSPVLAVAGGRAALFGVGFVARRIANDVAVVRGVAWLIALAVPAVALAFLVGLARWRLFVAGAFQRLVAGLPRRPEPGDLRVALADAFEDPALEIAYWITDDGNGEGHWANASGQPVRTPAPGTGRRLTAVYDGDRKVAAIIHDAALGEDRGFLDAATSYVVITLDNQRLASETESLVREVAESTMRIQATADDERRRIEHEVHQGAQQRLVGLRIRLELAAEQAEAGVRSGDPALFRALSTDVDAALEVISSLAREIYPAALDRGLVEALQSAALQGALPTTVLARGIGRYSREIESAVYFSCLEALQNAAKHARGATTVVVDLFRDDGVLRLEVRDDGAGFDMEDATEGVGLTGIRDRLGAVGGGLEVRSRPGHGTQVMATIPIPKGADR